MYLRHAGRSGLFRSDDRAKKIQNRLVAISGRHSPRIQDDISAFVSHVGDRDFGFNSLDHVISITEKSLWREQH
jgi:hypothetical protein